MAKELTEERAINSIFKHPGVGIDPVKRRLKVDSNNTPVGIKTWGKIDFLINKKGYSWSN